MALFVSAVVMGCLLSSVILHAQSEEPCYVTCPLDYPGNDVRRCLPCCDARCIYYDDWRECRKRCLSFAIAD
jgi:hypothetical protein